MATADHKRASKSRPSIRTSAAGAGQMRTKQDKGRRKQDADRIDQGCNQNFIPEGAKR